ncbi:nectin-4-like isoform 1-T1 [Acanthopagrus schlegelii]
MALSAVVHLLCVFGLFQKGLTGLIGTQRTVMAAVGGEAGFSCQLLQIKDVVQVTWLKVLPEGDETLASYTTRYGERVNPAFKDKIGFTDAGLQSSSIFIRNVTEEDEGCYLCLFNIRPGDDLEATTCLQIYGFHEDSGIEITCFTIITTLSVVLVFCCVAAAVIAVLLIQRQRNSRRQRDSKKINTPLKTTEDTEENKAPLMHQDNENLRKRTPTEKSDISEPSPETCHKLV